MARIRLFGAMAVCVLVALAAVQPAPAQSVLKVQRGLASSDVVVLTNRAVVVESTEPFTELSVAQPEIADVQPLSETSIYILGRQRGATTLTLLGEGGALISNVTVRVMPDLGELKNRLGTLLPGEDIEVRPSGTGVVLSGVVTGASKIDQAMRLARAYVGDNVTNLMSVGGTQQVSLKVRIAEMSRSVGKEIGINLGLVGANNRASPFAQTGDNIDIGGGDGQIFPDGGEFDGFTNILSSFGTFGAVFSIANNYLLDLQIDALEEKGFARLLSEPTLVALSGNEAEFLAGGEVPIPTVNEDGEVDVEFRPVGVNVIFEPRVLDDNLINLAVSAEVSDVDAALSTTSSGIDITGFRVRRATTTIELRDGQSFAIAGLYEDDFADTVRQVPFLGDIPVLGTLFRSTSFQKGETELVIIVSVNLVTPVGGEEELALPTDRIQIPNEAELFLFGNTVAGGGAVMTSTQGFDGDFGYAVD
jgi:pilus assembly protein CpaC